MLFINSKKIFYYLVKFLISYSLLSNAFRCKSSLYLSRKLNTVVNRMATKLDIDSSNIKESILAVDIGSTCVKCAAFECEWPLRQVADISFELCSTTTLQDGIADPNEIFGVVTEVVDSVIKSLRKIGVNKIKAVGFTSFVMNIFGVDETGQPITPCYTYASHQPRNEIVEESLRRELNREDHLRTGAVIHSSYATVQLRTMIESGQSFPSVYKWQTLSSHTIAKWTGQPVCPVSYSDASWTGLLDFRTCEWDQKAVSSSKLLSNQLPELQDSATSPITASLSEYYLTKWPEMKDTKLFLGLGDGAAASLGSLCNSTNRIAVTIGTSCAARVIIPLKKLSPTIEKANSVVESDSISTPPPMHSFAATVPPPGLWCYRVDGSSVLVGGALTDGGALIEWISNLVGQDILARARERLAEIVENEEVSFLSTCPQTLPFWSGERSPGWHSLASGTISGITRSTDVTSILYSLKESVAIRLRFIIDEMVTSGLISDPSLACIVASGKGMGRSKDWRQILADVAGFPVVRLSLPGDATPRGVVTMILNALTGTDGSQSDNFSLHSNSNNNNDNNIEGNENESKASSAAAKFGFREGEVENIVYPRSSMKAFYDKRYKAHENLYNTLLG